MTVVPPSQGCREDPCGDAFRPLPSTLAGTPPPALGGWWAAAVSPLPLLPSSPRCVSERDRNWAGVSSPSPVNLGRPGLPLQTRAASSPNPRSSPRLPLCPARHRYPVPRGGTSASSSRRLCRAECWSAVGPPRDGRLGVTLPAAARSAGVGVLRMPGGRAVGVAAPQPSSVSSSVPGSGLPHRDRPSSFAVQNRADRGRLQPRVRLAPAKGRQDGAPAR